MPLQHGIALWGGLLQFGVKSAKVVRAEKLKRAKFRDSIEESLNVYCPFIEIFRHVYNERSSYFSAY